MNIRNAFDATVRFARFLKRGGQLPLVDPAEAEKGGSSAPPEIMTAGNFQPSGGRGPKPFDVPPRRR